MKNQHKIEDYMDENKQIFRDRNEKYGNNFEHFGKFAKPLFERVKIKFETETDFNRFAILIHILGKFTRYINNFDKGGHEDSLNDISNYALILKYLDEKERKGNDNF